MPTVQQKIEASRNDLLDLGLRNPLISFRSTVRSIDVVDEKSVEVFRILVTDTRGINLLPKTATTQNWNSPVIEGSGPREVQYSATVFVTTFNGSHLR